MFAFATAPTLVAKGRRAAKGVAAAALFALNLACYYLGISKMLSFVGRGMCTSVSADQRSEALGARNAGECRLAQDGLEHGEAGAGVDERQEEQGDEEESGERATEHFEESRPLVVERVHRRDRFELPQIVP